MRLLQVLHVCIATISNTIFCILCYCQFAGIRLESSGLVWRQFEVLDFKVANFSWTCFGIFSFLFIYLFIYLHFFFIEMTLTNLPITSSDVPPSSSYKTFLHSLSAKFRWYILLESLKLSEISKVTITFTRELIIPTLLANKIYPLQG